MKVVVLGNTGMLGHMLQKVLTKQLDSHVIGFGRESLELYPRTLNQIGTKLTSLLGHDTDWVINCMGATKPYFNSIGDLTNPLYTNSVFPHQLAQWAELMSVKVIHITTDCVYDGCIGRYDERAPHCPQDLYGKSKSLGEPFNCMVLRTSIIGPEADGRSRHFLSWVKKQDGKRAKGFDNHKWNGLTTLELSYVISDIIDASIYNNGIFHIFSDDVTKFQMFRIIADVYGLDIEIDKHKTRLPVDRRLRTVKELNDIVGPHKFKDMIEELYEYEQKT